MMKDLESKMYEKQLMPVGLFSPEWRRGLMAAYSSSQGVEEQH